MKPFALLIDYDVLEFIRGLGRNEQAAIRKRFDRIREYPNNCAHYSEVDPQGRLVQINLEGKYALKYWVDSADHHIKVLDIVPSDRKR